MGAHGSRRIVGWVLGRWKEEGATNLTNPTNLKKNDWRRPRRNRGSGFQPHAIFVIAHGGWRPRYQLLLGEAETKYAWSLRRVACAAAQRGIFRNQCRNSEIRIQFR